MAVVSMSKQEFSRLEVLLRVQSGRLRVADARRLRPRGFRVARLQRADQMAVGLGDDVDAAFDPPALPPIGLERIDRHAHPLAADMLDRLDDVGKARGEGAVIGIQSCRREATSIL